MAISASDMLLIQVKSRDWPSILEREALEAFRVPGNCRKRIHRWKDGQRRPDVLEVS